MRPEQSVAEAYRGQLRFMRDKTDAYWQARATALQQSAGKGGAPDFARNVRAGSADSFIFANYPALSAPLIKDAAADRPDWRAALAFEDRHNRLAAIGAWAVIAKSDVDVSTAARAAQAQIRLLTGEKEAAIKAIDEYFARGRIAKVTDLQGRLIAADEQLLALHLLPPRDAGERQCCIVSSRC